MTFQDIGRDVHYAFRTFRKAPLFAITVVGTVALGLGLVAMAFTIFDAFFFRPDAVRNPHEMFAVRSWREGAVQEPVTSTREQFERLRHQSGAFADAFAIRRGVGGRLDGRALNGTLVSGNFFDVLDARASQGRTLLGSDDEGGGRRVIVLSHVGWTAIFGRTPGIVGRVVRINGVPYEVVGVMPDGFRGLSIGAPDYWAPLSRFSDFRRGAPQNPGDVAVDIIGRLRPGAVPESAVPAVQAWAAAEDRGRGRDGAVRVRLEPRQGTLANDASEALLVFVPLFAAFGLILLIGCANVASLLLARGVSRQREIGIRLSLGASRRRVARQLLTESVLLALAAAGSGFLISRVALAGTLRGVLAALPVEISEGIRLSLPPADWRVALFLLVGAILATAFFGLAPALLATRIELVRAMRGEVTRDARPGRARGLMIGVQVAASALLLICAAIFLRSASASAAVDIGVRIHDTVGIGVAVESSREAIVSAVREHPLVSSVAASAPGPLNKPRPAVAHAASADVAVGYRLVSPEFFRVLGVGVVRGRPFTEVERNPGNGVAIVSETAARRLWPGRDALGETVRVASDRQGGTPDPNGVFTIVGIARDVPGFRLGDWPIATVYLPISLDTRGTSLTARVHGHPDQARTALYDRLSTIDPAIDEINTLRVSAGVDTFLLRLGFWLSLALAALALAFTLSGLFSVLSYVVEQRTNELGIRIALGASSREVTRLVLGQLLRQAAFGFAAGAMLALALAAVLRSAAVMSRTGDVIRVLDPVAYVAGLICIAATCAVAAWIPARRAARIDPITTLRRD